MQVHPLEHSMTRDIAGHHFGSFYGEGKLLISPTASWLGLGLVEAERMADEPHTSNKKPYTSPRQCDVYRIILDHDISNCVGTIYQDDDLAEKALKNDSLAIIAWSMKSPSFLDEVFLALVTSCVRSDRTSNLLWPSKAINFLSSSLSLSVFGAAAHRSLPSMLMVILHLGNELKSECGIDA